MFERLVKWRKRKFEDKRRVSGLSAGLDIVDKYLRPGMNPDALDFSAGYAQARIHGLYETGQITKEEMEAALFTLHDHHEKLRRRAMIEIMIG